jgi:hypothetical protein
VTQRLAQIFVTTRVEIGSRQERKGEVPPSEQDNKRERDARKSTGTNGRAAEVQAAVADAGQEAEQTADQAHGDSESWVLVV